MIDVKVNWLEEIDSTNSEANRHRHESSDFTVWAARFQTAGRGQRGNSWESSRGENLTFSILLKPLNFLSNRQFELSQVVALGVVHYLHTKGLEAKIKWPNDIYIGDRKVCGILIENVLSGDTLSVSVAGVGVNLNQKVFRSDAPNPTSVALEIERIGGSPEWMEDAQELTLLLGQIAILYEHLLYHNGKEEIERLYLSSLYRKDELHLYEDLTTSEVFEGYIRGVEPNACLRIERADGGFKYFAFKELKYILSPR